MHTYVLTYVHTDFAEIKKASRAKIRHRFYSSSGAGTVVLALPHLRREEQRRPDEGLGASERVLHGLRDAEVRELGVPALWAGVARRTQQRPRGSVKTNRGETEDQAKNAFTFATTASLFSDDCIPDASLSNFVGQI